MISKIPRRKVEGRLDDLEVGKWSYSIMCRKLDDKLSGWLLKTLLTYSSSVNVFRELSLGRAS